MSFLAAGFLMAAAAACSFTPDRAARTQRSGHLQIAIIEMVMRQMRDPELER